MSFVVADFFNFVQHYLMHKVPFLWSFHKIHHSAEVLTPLTFHRFHPVEKFIDSMRHVLTGGFIGGCFLFFCNGQVSAVEILGVNALGFLFNFIGSNLRHSSLPLSFGIGEYFFISPAQHQTHHVKDPNFYDKNFGLCLSVWDQLLGSFLRGRVLKRKAPDSISYGIEGGTVHSLGLQLALPFKKE